MTTEVLQCKGPNDGVEHHELGTAVFTALGTLGVHVSKGIAFVKDLASVLQKAVNSKQKKAFNAILKLLCPNAWWVPCFGHALNNVAKES